MLRLTKTTISMASLAVLLWAAVPTWAQEGRGEHEGDQATERHADEADEHGGREHAAGQDPALAACEEFIATVDVDRAARGWKSAVPEPPQFEFDPDAEYFWILETNKGAIRLKLMPDVAPMHVSSTIYLTELGFYDDVVFHRIIRGFMAQGGDPTGTGRGGPGYKYAGEFDRSVQHDRPGMLSMANAGPGTDGSQFFLTFVPAHGLDGKHTIFGEVVEGMNVVKGLATFDSGEIDKRTGQATGKTTERIFIESASIEVVPGSGGDEDEDDEG